MRLPCVGPPELLVLESALARLAMVAADRPWLDATREALLARALTLFQDGLGNVQVRVHTAALIQVHRLSSPTGLGTPTHTLALTYAHTGARGSAPQRTPDLAWVVGRASGIRRLRRRSRCFSTWAPWLPRCALCWTSCMRRPALRPSEPSTSAPSPPTLPSCPLPQRAQVLLGQARVGAQRRRQQQQRWRRGPACWGASEGWASPRQGRRPPGQPRSSCAGNDGSMASRSRGKRHVLAPPLQCGPIGI
jgi:hypothetical protein